MLDGWVDGLVGRRWMDELLHGFDVDVWLDGW